MKPQIIINRVLRFLRVDLWLLDSDDYSYWVGRSIKIAQSGYLCWLRYNESRSAVRAWSLTAISIFSLVPVLAFAFSIAKGFGVYDNLQADVIEPLIMNWLELDQLPELSLAITQLLSFIEQTDLRSLGMVGFVTVAYSVIRLMSAIEESLNDIWGAGVSRTFVRKVSDYLSVSIIVPMLLLLGATGVTAFHIDEMIHSMSEWGWVGAFLIRLVIIFVIWLGFTLIYMVMPNISISPKAAFYGGIVGGSLWLLVHQAHITLQVGIAGYNALYAGFSAFPIFMIWVYASWVSLLLGAVFASAQQNLDAHRQNIIRSSLLFCDRERLCLMLLLRLARQYDEDGPLYNKSELVDALDTTPAGIDVSVADLAKANLVSLTNEGQVLLSRDPGRIMLVDVVEAVMERREIQDIDSVPPDLKEVLYIYKDFYKGVRNLSLNQSLQSLAQQAPLPEVLEDSAEAKLQHI